MLKEQQQEMQRRHKEKQQLQTQSEGTVEAYCIKCMAQKAKRVIKAKEREDAEKRRIVKEKKKRLEYIQQL